MKLELKLKPDQERAKRASSTNLYAIVAGTPLNDKKKVKEIQLYLAPADLSDVIAYAGAPDLDGAIQDLFDHAIDDRLDGGDSARSDFLGWPAIFTSFGFVETGGDSFFGYEPIVKYKVPTSALLKFAQLYTDRVVEAMKQEGKL